MDRHEVQGIAAGAVSGFLEYCLQVEMINEILAKKGYASQDIDQIKQAIQDIANEHAKTAEYHRAMGRAINVKPGPKKRGGA